jgi:hypothetical protein
VEHLAPMGFKRCVARYGGIRKIQSFTCAEQYLLRHPSGRDCTVEY